MRKHERDRRPESYRPDEHSIELGEEIGTKDKWRERWRWIRPVIGPSMCEFQRLQESTAASLGCIQPREVEDLLVEKVGAEWAGRKQSLIDQLVLFDNVETKLEKIPFIFKYRYRCGIALAAATRSRLLTGNSWNCTETFVMRGRFRTTFRGRSEKFLEELCGKGKDVHFFVGNHSRFPVSFMVLGVFWPPKTPQAEMF